MLVDEVLLVIKAPSLLEQMKKKNTEKVPNMIHWIQKPNKIKIA